MASDGLSDADIGLSDADIGLGGEQTPAPTQQASQGLSDSDIGLSDEAIGLNGPQPESPLMTGVREAAHNIIPGIAGMAAAPFGAAGGAAAGSVVPVVGTAAGGIAGGAGAYMLTAAAVRAIQDKLLAGTPLDDSEQMAVNRAVNHYSALTGELAGSMVGMSPAGVADTVGKELLTRGAAGAAQAGLGAITDKVQGNDIDPGDLAIQFAAGAAFPGTNAFGKKLEAAGAKFVPGRPNVPAPEGAAQAHADVGDTTVETAVGDSALAESPPRPTGETVGTPDENKPTNSRGEVATGKADGTYAKTPAPAAASTTTTGDMAPDVQAALASAQPEQSAPQAQAAPAAPQTYGLGPTSPGGRFVAPEEAARAPAPEQAPAPQVEQPQLHSDVDIGLPQPGEPLAMGENDAAPLPEGHTERAAQAIKTSQERAVAPDIEGQAAKPTEAQAEAGNYAKARTRDFGKPIAIETHAGEIRKGKGWEHPLPYDYGYFNLTKGPDGDHIDFARPTKDDPAFGDKHFIIDQKDAETGKYDEPKVFTYVKDKDAAIDLYNRGFGDGKGPDRMHDITEVSRGDLVKYLAKHTKSPPKGPYGNPIPKSAKDKVVFKDLVAKNPEKAAALQALPEEQVAAAIEGKRLRKYGVKGGYPVSDLTNDVGEPVTAKDKKLAAARGAVHDAISDWFKKTDKPQAERDKETNGETLDRIKSHGYPAKGEWAPTFKPEQWMLAKAARDTVAKPTPGNIDKFREAERLLRSGNKDAIDTYRGGNRVEADIARSRRAGDEAIQSAENEAAHSGVNTEEDKIIESIDRARRGEGEFEHAPAEEAETMVKPREIKTKADIKERPAKEIKVEESPLATKVPTKQKSVAKMSLKELTEEPKVEAKKEEFEPAKAASEGKSVKSKMSPEDMARLVEASNKAMKKTGWDDSDIKRFINDTSGAVGANRPQFDLRAYLKGLLQTTDHKSSFARSLTPKELVGNGEWLRDQAKDLHRIQQEDKLHRLVNMEASDKMWKDTSRDQLERIYHAREADSAHVDMPYKQAGKTNVESMPAADLKVYNDHLKPVFEENDKFFKAVQAIAPERLGPEVEHHVARITKGDTSEYNMLKDRDDPTGPQYNGLSVSATMQHERPFVALERVADGKRFVVQNRPEGGGFSLWDKYKSQRIKDPNWEFEANQPYSVTGKNGKVDYIMRHATSKEIEANARGADGKAGPMKYYKNAGLSAFMTNAQMGSMARHLRELARIAQTPEFKEMSTTNYAEAVKKGWQKETLLPNFKGTYMDPRLRELFDDYAKPGFDSPDLLRNLNHGVTKLLFWMPTAHIANVGTHWFVGRGFDNLNVKRGITTSLKAIKSVVNQDEFQKELMRNGAGTIYPSVNTRNFIEKMANRVGEEMVREPSKWGPIADTLGVPLGKLRDAIYNGSSKVMWMANDVFLTQRIMELQEKGKSLQQAIIHAERDIPNYQLPTRIIGSGSKGRFLQQLMADPNFTAFGRYHYGMFNAYANLVKDAVGSEASTGDRIDAIGKMMAMGVLAFGVYPVMDKAAQYLTGNEHATQNRRGPLGIPSHIQKALEGKEDVASAARSTMTVTPLMSTVLETLFNHDFRGKNIVEPGDVAAGAKGDLRRAGRAVLQEGEHAARGLISPLGTLANAYSKDKNDKTAGTGERLAKGAAKGVRDQAFDVKNPSDAAIRWEAKSGKLNERDARLREKHGGSGPLEDIYNKLTR